MLTIAALALFAQPAYAGSGVKLRNIRIRENGGGNTYSMDVELHGDVNAEVAEVQVEDGDSGTTFTLGYESSRHEGQGDVSFDAAPADATYAVALKLWDEDNGTLLSCSGKMGMAGAAASMDCSDGSRVEAGGWALDLVELRAWSTTDAQSFSLSLEVEDAALLSTAVQGTVTFSGGGAAAAPSAAVTLSFADPISVYSTPVSFSGNPIGAAFDLRVTALGAKGKQVEQEDFALEMVRENDPCGGSTGIVRSVTGNGKGTSQAAGNASSKAELL